MLEEGWRRKAAPAAMLPSSSAAAAASPSVDVSAGPTFSELWRLAEKAGLYVSFLFLVVWTRCHQTSDVNCGVLYRRLCVCVCVCLWRRRPLFLQTFGFSWIMHKKRGVHVNRWSCYPSHWRTFIFLVRSLRTAVGRCKVLSDCANHLYHRVLFVFVSGLCSPALVANSRCRTPRHSPPAWQAWISCVIFSSSFSFSKWLAGYPRAFQLAREGLVRFLLSTGKPYLSCLVVNQFPGTPKGFAKPSYPPRHPVVARCYSPRRLVVGEMYKGKRRAQEPIIRFRSKAAASDISSASVSDRMSNSKSFSVDWSRNACRPPFSPPTQTSFAHTPGATLVAMDRTRSPPRYVTTLFAVVLVWPLVTLGTSA